MSKLSIVKRQVLIDHPGTAVGYAQDIRDEDFKKFVQKLEKMLPDKVIAYSETVDEARIERLVSYVVINQYGVKLDNLFAVLNLRATKEQFFNLFYDWQKNHIRGREARPFIAKIIGTNEKMIEALGDNGIERAKLIWINSEHYIKMICSNGNASNRYIDFVNSLGNQGIFEGTELFDTCVLQFIMYCSADVYRELGDTEVASHFMRLKNTTQRAMFCANIISKISAFELYKMLNTSGRVFSAYSDSTQKNIIEEKLIEKDKIAEFQQWLKLYKTYIELRRGDEDPRRAEFWPRFITNNTIVVVNDFAMRMEFSEYIAIEFLGQAAGPAYLMTKEFYNAKKTGISNRFNYGTKEGDNGLRPKLYALWQNKEAGYPGYEGLINRMKHSDGQYKNSPWEGKFEMNLASIGIRPVM